MISEKFYDFDYNGRCLISPAIGCSASCSYCYCSGKKKKIVESPGVLIDTIVRDSRYAEEKTILSLGCYTECLEEDTVSLTIEIIEYFLKKKHRVSISTKMDSLILKDVPNRENLYVFISCPVFSNWKNLEQGTLEPNIRLLAVPELKSCGINPVLYIKPFLPQTALDIQKFKDVCIACDIDVVVGRKFCKERNNGGKEIKLINGVCYEEITPNYNNFFNTLKKIAKVYRNSMEVLKK